MADLSRIFKAYDVRGVVPDELDEEIAQAVGAAFVELTGASSVVTAHDMRTSSGPLAAAFARGATSRGADVINAGLGSTDMLYYASGSLDLPGVMFTASHNPAKYNGMKMCRAGAVPVGTDTGLLQIRDRAAELLDAGLGGDPGKGAVTERNLLEGYAAHLKTLVDLSGIRPLKVVVDAGNGMGGYTVPEVFKGLPIELTPLYFELDGSFPNHEANPIEPENLRDLQKAVVSQGADIGIAFDGDADRCWVIDERGESVSPSTITALVAVRELAKNPGATIIHNLITSKGVPEIVGEHGGKPVRTRVGHSFIKAEMARTGAVFGGEHSAHYYFRDFWFADSGMLAALHVLAALGEQDRPLSEVLAQYSRYAASGEINSRVEDQAGALARVRETFAGREGVTFDELDGLTVSGPDWWFNLRPSNTEPLLRLNAEAGDEEKVAAVRDEVLAVVRS
ncbi:phosphomannomutase/phosphoglucomutase [Microbispora sp. GKU 823]|uniref:phosphomannomutase/phosphoglucomutase n=1 Tax=Microbispora sp. GKU 823 TaxID=1652100 RepID=UPI0009A25ED0|nr:phosphomannomutase/phosphoglucomutase [Microbispora sp. GKU 823]OPG14041.1 phosphomannomutase/phosphoglucomutase [Microbispora sp. GKU 823]